MKNNEDSGNTEKKKKRKLNPISNHEIGFL